MATSVSVIEVLGPGCARCHETSRGTAPAHAIFVGVVTVAIIITGYLLNAVL